MNNSPWRPWRSALLLVGGLIALSVIAVEPPDKEPEVVAAGPNDSLVTSSDAEDDAGTGDATEEATGGATGGGTASGTGGTATKTGRTGTAAGPNRTSSGPTATATGDLQCKAGQNGGTTDKGVSGNRIKLAATNVRSGTGSSFLGSAYIGMQAVVNRVNAKGGVCGRLLELRLVDDAWDAAKGAGYLASFAQGDYFALPVVPSSEGLTTAINNKTISSAGIPVVGSDGMLKEQYSDSWVWPVATATVSTMRVMAKHAFDNGAKTFGIVYDNQYKFGIEGLDAFAAYVKQLPGADLKEPVGVPPGLASYSGEATTFNSRCNPACDFVAMLLTPETANVYINSQVTEGERKRGFGRLLTGGAQPLFNERFARDCGKFCDGMLVWTGYNPPVGRLASEPAVAAYVDDVKSVDPGVDVNNQFLEGAYLGMKVFVEALQKVGPRLTRAAVRDVMNSMTYESDLVSSLTWGPQVPQQRFANLSAQAFKIVTASGSFVGFAEANTGFLRDPTPGVLN
ncbi:MAG TPA: ABC transporter substrate-binding protein [Acidimicrobiales bacterium]|nr:ABC transporter substrate-binding protein [Acidimicrobiales bacterium]